MLADDIVDYLAAAGIGLTTGTNIFKVPVPETTAAAQVVSVIEYGGRPAIRAMGPSIGAPVAEVSRFQVAVIDQLNNYESARAMIESIYKKLDWLSNTTLGSTLYLQVRALQPPFYMPPGETQDPNAQHHFTCNFECWKARG